MKTLIYISIEHKYKVITYIADGKKINEDIFADDRGRFHAGAGEAPDKRT